MNPACKHRIPITALSLFLLAPGQTSWAAAPAYKGPLTVQLLGPLSTTNNKKGDKITAQVVSPSEFSGAIIEGVILEAKSSGKVKGTSSLNLAFRSMTYANNNYRLSCNVKGFQNSKGQQNVDDEGRVVKRNRIVGKAILGGVFGAAAGYALGGPSGAAIGGAAGVAAIIVVKLSTKAPSIDFASGSQVFLEGSATVIGGGT